MPDEIDRGADDGSEGGDEQFKPRPFWSGTISFGLVSIPVALYPANRSSRISARAIGPGGVPLSRRYFSAKTGRELAPDEMVRGYEIEKDRYVLVSDEELERLAPKKSRDIDLRQFVDEDQIPPLYSERGYFLVPEGDSTRAYPLLAVVMEKTRRAGIATFVMRGKEYLIAITSENGILRAETMRFMDEIRSPRDVGLPEKLKAPAARTHHFIELIRKHLSQELSRSELRDESSQELRKLLQARQARNQNVVAIGKAESPGENAPDLLAILKQSLERSPEGWPKHARTRSSRVAHRPHILQMRSNKRAGR